MSSRVYDWCAIRAFYEAGHSMGECKDRFGFSNGAWNRAVERGEIVTRKGRDRTEGRTRAEVARLLDEGRTQAQIARSLGLTMPAISHHARALGVPAKVECSRRYDWAAVQRYHDMGHTARECMAHFGFTSQTWHGARSRGDLRTRPAAAPISTYLVEGRRVARSHLKGRLIAEGLKENRCEECGLTVWRGRPLPLALHHVNGTGTTTGWRTCSCCAGTAIARHRTSRGRTRGGRSCRLARSG